MLAYQLLHFFWVSYCCDGVLPSSTFGLMACGLGFFVFLRVTKVNPSLSLVGASWLFAPNSGSVGGVV